MEAACRRRCSVVIAQFRKNSESLKQDLATSRSEVQLLTTVLVEFRNWGQECANSARFFFQLCCGFVALLGVGRSLSRRVQQHVSFTIRGFKGHLAKVRFERRLRGARISQYGLLSNLCSGELRCEKEGGHENEKDDVKQGQNPEG